MFRVKPVLTFENGIWLAYELRKAAKRIRSKDAFLAEGLYTRSNETQQILCCLLRSLKGVRRSEDDKDDALGWLLGGMKGDNERFSLGEPGFALGVPHNFMRKQILDMVHFELKILVALPDIQLRLDQLWDGRSYL